MFQVNQLIYQDNSAKIAIVLAITKPYTEASSRMENNITTSPGQEEKTLPLSRALVILGIVTGIIVAVGLIIGYAFFWGKYQHQTYSDIVLETARQHVKQNPKSAMAHLELGYAYLMQGKADQALKEYQKAYKLDPKNRQVQYNLALGYMAKKDYPAAIKILEPLTKQGLFDLEAHYSLGEAYYNNGQYREALKAFSQAAGIRPGLANIYYYMALCYEKLGDKNNAIAQIDKALRLAPNYTEFQELKAKLIGQPVGGEQRG